MIIMEDGNSLSNQTLMDDFPFRSSPLSSYAPNESRMRERARDDADALGTIW